MAKMKELFPQHYAMVVLGFSIGARPSSLRPLRRRGPEADITWPTAPETKGRVQIRRSHTRGDEIMDQTKTGQDLDIPLPASVIRVLREHVASLDGFMEDSDLLFPAVTGRLRACSVLDKPFREVVAALGWTIHLTPRAMRRTFQDLSRHAHVHDLVTRRISGHATEEMQFHYSTAEDEEMLSAVTEVATVLLAGPPPLPAALH